MAGFDLPFLGLRQMVKLKQFRYGADNLAYLLHDHREAVAIDGGAAEEILSFLRDNDLRLILIANTHNHPDHVVGNEILARETAAPVAAMGDLDRLKSIRPGGREIKVYRTPGHTDDSVCFHAGDYLITGDTLFNGTVGNCFSGDLRAFYISLKRIMALPARTLIYPGHDYLELALEFLARLDPGNETALGYRNSCRPGEVFSTLAEELKMNPYLRFNEPGMKEILKERGLSAAGPWQRFLSLMSIE